MLITWKVLERLDLKQSDIFRHFGEVKEDKANFYGNRVTAASGSPDKTGTNRRDVATTNDTEKDLEEARDIFK